MRFLKSTSRFQKNFMHVLKANVLAQVIQLAAMPVLTRMFGPDSFAVLALFMSFMTIVLSFCTFRFDWSMPNAKSKEEALDLAVISTIAIVLTFSVMIVGYKFALPWLKMWEGFSLIEPYVVILVLAIITGAMLQIFQGWFVHEADLKESSKSRMANAISNTGFKLVGGAIAAGTPTLLWSIIFGNICAIIVQIRNIWVQWTVLFKKFSWNHLKNTFKRFASEAFLSSLVSLANGISLSMIPLLLATYYMPKEVGWYALVNRLALAPLSLITSAVMQSFWAEAAKLIKTDKKKLQQLYLESSMRLALLCVPVIIVCVCAPLYARLLFGAEWDQAGYILMALTPMIIGQIIVSPLSHLIVHGKQIWQLLWDVLRFIITGVMIVLCARWHIDIYWTVFYLSIFSLVMYGILFVMNYYFLSKHMKYQDDQIVV